MLGSAKTDNFMLGTAGVMLGRQEDLFNLTEKHALGLVKNVTVKTTPGFVELRQGIKNTLAYSMMNSNAVSITAEMYEYTVSNLAYSLSLDGSKFAPQSAATTLGAIYVAPVAAAPGLPIAMGLAEIELLAVLGFAAGNDILIHTGIQDNVMLRKIVSLDVPTKTATLNFGLPLALAVGAKIEKVNILAVGSAESAPFMACKIVGTLANGDTVPMLFPKVRVKSGLTMAFKTDAMDHIPFELEIYDLLESDPNYAMFAALGNASGMIVD